LTRKFNTSLLSSTLTVNILCSKNSENMKSLESVQYFLFCDYDYDFQNEESKISDTPSLVVTTACEGSYMNVVDLAYDFQ
jgi:hypothetical protein